MIIINPLCFLAILLTASLSSCEIYIATDQLKPLIETESSIVAYLEKYIALQQYVENPTPWQAKKLYLLRKHLFLFKKQHLIAMKDHEHFFENPLNAYLIIKKLTVDLKDVMKLLETDDIPFFTYGEDVVLPNKEDLNGASLALARLQDVYDLKTSDLARGELNGVKEAAEFTASDCFELGKELFEIQDSYHSFLWMREALYRINDAYEYDHLASTPVQNEYDENSNEELNHIHGYEPEYVHDYEPDIDEEPEYDFTQVSLMSILEYMAYCSYNLGNYALASTLYKNLTSLLPSYQSALEGLLDDVRYKYSSNSLNGQNNLAFIDGLKFKGTASHFNKLCQEKIKPPEEVTRTLRCYYSDNNVPFLKISPFKVEELFRDPVNLVMFHGVLSENEVTDLIELALPKLTKNNEISSKVQYRISKSAYFHLSDSIEQRIMDMTSLNSAGFELLHIANYGLGGQYQSHYDFGSQRFGLGNRIATVLFYLSDVPQGGATIFNYIEVAVRPEKGAAIFWYNLLDSGEGNKLSVHAGCPVLQGSKWIATEWVHEYHQEFVRPCGLERPPYAFVQLIAD